MSQPPIWRRMKSRLDAQLTDDATAAVLLKDLDGRRVRFELVGLKRAFDIAIRADGLSPGPAAGDADVTLAATPATFLALAAEGRGGAGRDTGNIAGVKISGDLTVAQGFQRLMPYLAPDWEDLLAEALGDLPAHGIGRVAAGARDIARNLARTLADSTSDYLLYEGGKVATGAELEGFASAVASLRDDVDRLEARIRSLTRSRAPGAGDDAGTAPKGGGG